MNNEAYEGLSYTNKFGMTILLSLQDILGNDEFSTVLGIANLTHLLDNLPPDNFEKEFIFSNVSAINQALEQKYGWRGGRGLSLRAGREIFSRGFKHYGLLAGVEDVAFRELPLEPRLKIGLHAMIRIFSQLSDQQIRLGEDQDTYIYTITGCPDCLGRSDLDKPVCFMEVGLLQEGLNWISGGSEFRVNESRCIAMGDQVCEFLIQKSPLT